jgi:dTDP-4-dehydrorhamnose 3,5-epimerase
MGKIELDNIVITNLRIIETDGGDVMHGLKQSEVNFCGFGEAYFSKINYNAIKGWKKHLEMTMNLIVPFGNVRFVFYSETLNYFRIETIGEDNYNRITVPPGIWFAFQGLDKKKNIILNISNLMHNPEEVRRKNIGDIQFNWKI